MKPYKERIEGFTAQFKEQMASLYEQGYKDGAVGVTEKVGKWKFVQRGNFIDVCCSECGYARVKEYGYGCKVYDLEENEMDNLLSNSSMHFCENCGARMEGGADNG